MECMTTFHWLSDTFRRRSRREKFVLAGGLTITVATIAIVYAVQPFVRRWVDREAEIDIRAEQLARLRALVAQEQDLRDALNDLRRVHERATRVLLEGDTPAVASSGLLILLNRYAEESRVLIERVDLAGQLDATADSLLPIPATITARGDIFGLVDLLFYLQHGEKLLVIDDLRVSTGQGVGDRSPVMGWTVGLHGYYAGKDTI
jgi:D-serine dehydratase